MAVPAGHASVKFPGAMIVAWAISLLKVAVTLLLIATPVTAGVLARGVIAVTVGTIPAMPSPPRTGARPPPTAACCHQSTQQQCHEPRQDSGIALEFFHLLSPIFDPKNHPCNGPTPAGAYVDVPHNRFRASHHIHITGLVS